MRLPSVRYWQQGREAGELQQGVELKLLKTSGEWAEVIPVRDWSQGSVWVPRNALKAQVSPLNFRNIPQGKGQCVKAWEHMTGLDLPKLPDGMARTAGAVLPLLGFRQIQVKRSEIPVGATLVFPSYGSTGHIAVYVGDNCIRDNHYGGNPHPIPHPKFTVWVR